MKNTKKRYETPSLVTIGKITSLTGMFRTGNYLDNSNGSDAWKTIIIGNEGEDELF